MVQPVTDQAAQQIGPAQERAVGGRGPAQHQVVAAARPGVAPVDHELLGAEAALARLLVQRRGVGAQLVPAVGRMDVHLDDARVGRDLDLVQAVVGRRLVALESQGLVALAGDVLDGRHQIDELLQQRDRRQEQMQDAVARLQAQGRAQQGRRLGPGHARAAVAPLVQHRRGRQRRAGRQRIALVGAIAILLALPGQAVER